MNKTRCCIQCTIKLAAFIGALMSVLVFCFSTIVLISILHSARQSTTTNTTTTSNETESSPHSPNSNSNSILLIPNPIENATDQSHLEATFPLSNSSEIRSSGEDITSFGEENNTSTPPPPTSSSPQTLFSTSISPSSSSNSSLLPNSTGESDMDADTDISNNTDTSTFHMSTSLSLTLSLSFNSSEESSSEEKPWNSFMEQQKFFWGDKTDTYIILMEASSATGIFAALLQLSFCLLLLCGSGGKGLRDRTTLWNLSNFIVLILSIVIILLPISYNNKTDTFKRGSVFWRDLYRMMMDSLELSDKALENVWNNLGNFLTRNFTLYYYVIGLNSFILFAFLIFPLISCLVLPCKKVWRKKYRNHDEKTESDLMLFETGGDPFRYS